MRKEARLLLEKGIDSLILSVEHFNRPFETGRPEAVLILLDHSFEMLLKAAIVERNGNIWERSSKQTIGFDACLRKGLDDGQIKFLGNEQALSLQIINNLRDAAQHYLLEISEDQLYIHAQSGLTLFRELLKTVFNQELSNYMPERVLPISLSPPKDLATLFDNEVKEIQQLLSPKHRRSTEAGARLKSLAIVDAAVRGEAIQPSENELRKLMKAARTAKDWRELFPGVAVLNISAEGVGPSLSLRINKKEGVPVQIVPEGTPGAAVVAVRRVDELSFYNLGLAQLAEKVNLTPPKALAAVRFGRIQDDPECFKKFTVGKTVHARYSPKAIDRIKQLLSETPIEQIWSSRN